MLRFYDTPDDSCKTRDTANSEQRNLQAVEHAMACLLATHAACSPTLGLTALYNIMHSPQ